MCGIVGHIAREGHSPDIAGFNKAMAVISDRGPDDSGSVIENHVALGHRRLGIIDPQHNTQPLESACGRYVMTYNGEIYNYRELNDYLEQRGVVVHYKNDTRILLALYALEGEACLTRLNGMFAFAVWDRQEQTLFAARDRLGEKPFFYSTLNNEFYFASTVAALKEFQSQDLRISQTKIVDFFAHQYISQGTVYEQLHKLAPGHWLRFSPRTGLTSDCYWRIPAIDPVACSREEAIEKIRFLLDDSIKLRLRSDVPLGVFLSGGVDSSIITSQAVKYINPIKTFCAGFKEPSYDESELAYRASQLYGTQHHKLEILSNPDDLVDILIEITKVIGEPFADPAIVPTWQLCKLAAQEVKVALSGDGADEIFGGYRRYYAAKYADRFLGSGFASGALFHLARLLPDTHQYFAKSWPKKIILLSRYVQHRRHFPEDRLPRTFATDELQAVFGQDAQQSNLPRRHFGEYASELQKHQLTDLGSYLPDNILVKTDRISMHFGLEVRTPFLDHRILEQVVHYPDAYKVSLRDQKKILKAAYRDNLLRDVMRKPKHGFASPLHQWLSSSLVPVLESAIVDKDLNDYLNTAYIGELWRNHRQGICDNSHKLWNVVVFYLWLKEGKC